MTFASKQKSIRRLAATLFFSSALLGAACGTNQGTSPATVAVPSKTTGDTQDLKKEKDLSDELDAANSSREKTQKQVEDLQKSIDSLGKDLSSSKDMSTADKKELQAKIEEAEKAKAAAEANLKSIADRQAALDKELQATKKANEELAKKVNQAPQVILVPQASASTVPSNEAATPLILGRRYAITSGSNCLDVSNASKATSARLLGYPCSYQSNQVFTIEKASTQQYRIIGENSGLCLYMYGASTQDGAPLEQQTCRRNGDSSELFTLVGSTTAAFTLQNVRSKLCLKILSNRTVVQSSCTNNYSIFALKAL